MLVADDDMVTEVRVNWDAVEALAATAVNQFMAQVGLPAGKPPVPDGIYIGIGSVQPPVVLDDEERRRKMATMTSVDVAPVIKLYMSRERAQ